MTLLTLIRHAEQERPRSDEDLDPGLTARGLEQAELLAGTLALAPSPRELLVSPTRRTRETAAPIARVLGVPVREVPALTEFGLMPAGAPRPEDALQAWRRFRHLPEEPEPDPVETLGAFLERVRGALDDLLAEGEEEHRVAVVHGGVIKVAFFHLLGLPMELATEVLLAIDHGGIFRWERMEGRGRTTWKLVCANETGLPRTP